MTPTSFKPSSAQLEWKFLGVMVQQTLKMRCIAANFQALE